MELAFGDVQVWMRNTIGMFRTHACETYLLKEILDADSDTKGVQISRIYADATKSNQNIWMYADAESVSDIWFFNSS